MEQVTKRQSEVQVRMPKYMHTAIKKEATKLGITSKSMMLIMITKYMNDKGIEI